MISLGAAASLSARRGDDVMVLANGDHLIGEIKGLAQGELRFSSDYIDGTFRVDWQRVQQLQSRNGFRVELVDGRHYTGTIARYADGRFTITEGGTVTTVTASEVAGILQMERSVWAQLDGQINSGFSYTSDDSDTQFSASGTVRYVADWYAVDGSGSSTFSGQSGGTPSSSRNTVTVLNSVTVAQKYFAVGLFGLLNSDQQDLQLRTTAGGGVGRWLARTTHTQLATFGGLVYTDEHYNAVQDTTEPSPTINQNLEAVGGLQYAYHRFKTVDIQAGFTIFPSLTTPGRVRLGVAPTLSIEVVHNLDWNFTVYENYDSHPPVNANKNDFGVTNSVGWKF
jgi:hypothetical protein